MQLLILHNIIDALVLSTGFSNQSGTKVGVDRSELNNTGWPSGAKQATRKTNSSNRGEGGGLLGEEVDDFLRAQLADLERVKRTSMVAVLKITKNPKMQVGSPCDRSRY